MVPARIQGELEGALEHVEGLVVRLRAPKAFPPGQPLAFTLQCAGTELRYEARSIGSKRRDDGAFELRARLINLRKEAREALERLMTSVERG